MSGEVVAPAQGQAIHPWPSADLTPRCWQTAGAASAGIFRCYFVVYTTTETEHFPAARDGLIVGIDSETQTAEEAYEASL